MDHASSTAYPTPTTSARWVVPVLVPVLVALVWAALAAPMPDGVQFAPVVAAALLWGAILVLITLGVGAVPLLLDRQRGAVLALAVVSMFVMLTALSGRIPRLPFFAELEHNWQGKVLDLLWVGLLFLVLRRWARREAGLIWRIRSGSGRWALIVIAGVFVLFIALTLLAVATDPGAHQQVGVGQVLYNATIPNLTEELIWRGAMLAVLDRALGTSWHLAGAPVGWGLVVTSVAFGAGHLIVLSADGVFSLNIGGGIFATVMGVALAWIWAYTRSVWPAFLLHCAPEVGLDVGMLITG